MSSSAKREVWSVVQIIAGVALMVQSYLVTEDDNKRLNSDQKVFKWLVAVLACAIKGKRWRGYGFAVIEVIEVADVLTFILIIISIVFHHPSLCHSRLKTFLFCKSFPL